MQLPEAIEQLERIAAATPTGECAVKVSAFERLLKMPVLFTDQHGLHFLLYPGQNAQVYFENRGNYETAETKFCTRSLRPGMTVLDEGANIGMYTLLFAKCVGPEGQVHSFEAEKKNYGRLSVNLAINGFRNVWAHHLAVFSDCREVVLNVFPDSVNAWHSLGRPTLPDPWKPGCTMTSQEEQVVKAVNLDEYCREHSVGHIHLLKVDVEGAELDVFQGCERLLSQAAIDAVLFEISLPQIEAMSHQPEEVLTLLRRFGYEVFELNDDGLVSAKVVGSFERYRNYVALARHVVQASGG